MARSAATLTVYEQPRTTRTNTVNSLVSLVEEVIAHPSEAGAMLEKDLAAGGDPRVVLALLDAAAALAQLRGVNVRTQLAGIRKRIERRLAN